MAYSPCLGQAGSVILGLTEHREVQWTQPVITVSIRLVPETPLEDPWHGNQSPVAQVQGPSKGGLGPCPGLQPGAFTLKLEGLVLPQLVVPAWTGLPAPCGYV